MSAIFGQETKLAGLGQQAIPFEERKHVERFGYFFAEKGKRFGYIHACALRDGKKDQKFRGRQRIHDGIFVWRATLIDLIGQGRERQRWCPRATRPGP